MQPLERATIRAVYLRVCSLLFAAYFFNALDRFNVGFASLRMNRDLGLDPSQFGFGAGLLAFTYVLVQLPGTLLLDRLGPRRWLALIATLWGLLAAGMAFVRDAPGFYMMRLLLGAAEGCFTPAVLYVLTLWVPDQWRGRATAMLFLATPAAIVVGGPLSGLLISLQAHAGLTGWQWMFILEGVPSVLFGIVLWTQLPDRPEEARWLSAQQRGWLRKRLDDEQKPISAHGLSTVRAALASPVVWLLALMFFGIQLSSYGSVYWLPHFIRSLAANLSDVQIGLLSAVPFIGYALTALCISWSSDRAQERYGHFAVATGVAGIGCVVATSPVPLAAYTGLVLISAGAGGAITVFWTIPGRLLTGAATAAGIALISAVGNCAGFVGPYAIGWIRQGTGSFRGAFHVLAITAAISTLLSLAVTRLKSTAPPAGA